jgi:hypothetical protein
MTGLSNSQSQIAENFIDRGFASRALLGLHLSQNRADNPPTHKWKKKSLDDKNSEEIPKVSDCFLRYGMFPRQISSLSSFWERRYATSMRLVRGARFFSAIATAETINASELKIGESHPNHQIV